MVFASLSFMFILLPLFLVADFIVRYFLYKKKTYIMYKFRKTWMMGGGKNVNSKISSRNIVLFLISLMFYIWGEVNNVFILIVLGVINYYAGNIIFHRKHCKFTAVFFIIINLAVLVGFKYTYWILSFISPDLMPKQPALPLGISFFTFHAISYLIDVWRGHIRPAESSLDFLTYFCMFPHLVAGPIVRYAQVQDDLASRGPDKELFCYGMYRFLVGLNKKVLIANSVAQIADAAFTLSAGGHLQFFDAWLGITAYSVQIYFDFSGYSDMAIGLAAMAGFRFEENFRRPYSSTSIRDFWRRWHISLSSWLRDYLYIPLGGSRGGEWATYRNQIIVFFLCGLWHGASVTFVIWGLWHGAFLVLERMKIGRWLDGLPSPLARSYALLAVMIGWVFFRAETMSAAGDYLLVMFTPSLSPALLTHYVMGLAALAVGVLLCLVPDRLVEITPSKNPGDYRSGLYLFHALLAVVSVSMLLTSQRNPFIYFNF